MRKVGDLKDTGGSLNLEGWGGWVAKGTRAERAARDSYFSGSLWHRTPNVARNEIYSPAKTVRALRKPQFQCLSFRKSWNERRARASSHVDKIRRLRRPAPENGTSRHSVSPGINHQLLHLSVTQGRVMDVV